jgi:TrmH family RNA methyltransferase
VTTFDHIGNPAGGTAEAFRRALTPGGREAAGRFLIEGTRLHERALRAGVHVDQALVAASVLRDPAARERELLLALERSGTRLHAANRSLLSEFTSGRALGGFLGLVGLPAPRRLSQTLDARGLILVGIDVEDPGNIGALLRTALASGAAGFVAVGISDPWHPKAVRTSMGSVFKLPILRYDDVAAWLGDLAGVEATVVAAVSRDGAPAAQAGLDRRPLVLHVGSEAFGLPAAVLSRPVERVSIPMSAALDSFSVNAAAAILLYEATRAS